MRRMVSYGHSWVDGDGASADGTCLAALVAARLGLELDNRGVGGSSSTGTAALVLQDTPPPAVLYLVMTGLNDLRLGGGSPSSLQQYEDALRTIFGAVRQASPEALVVALAQPHLLDFSLHAPHNRGSNALVDTYNLTLRRIAAAHRGVVVVEPDGWDAASMLDADTVHPNDAGHACLARAAVVAVTAAWQ
ncbi:SGNH/GDSL hydrolase family protein [Pseudarthrobacter sp. R1]|uniref:SGNH/GDSL hydrolase family protein n=1 Tax=Pseudarthrobacter sp. R1 TaxID=2944934 RepID=UPI00210C7CE9|nr:SGNH/GDSL hydrolase family protein [Pseudarthrobacter sp. R1]MCQ6273256.1 SGNH/GDSL hydrolase family protein [Pseudarthrobacter sp. R1]